jgi:hypothetical protein
MNSGADTVRAEASCEAFRTGPVPPDAPLFRFSPLNQSQQRFYASPVFLPWAKSVEDGKGQRSQPSPLFRAQDDLGTLKLRMEVYGSALPM